MKILSMLLVVCLLLCGCSAAQTFEKVEDVYVPGTAPVQQEVLWEMPEENLRPVQSEYGSLYFCDGYEITQEILQAGNLSRTLQQLTGYTADKLTVLETQQDDAKRYECVWTAAGEGGNTVGRAVILDDGYYHYCMTAMAQEEEIDGLRKVWQELFDSFILG